MRNLTKKEVDLLISYNLPPRVEKIVYDSWTKKSYPYTKTTAKEGIMFYVYTIITYLLPFLLWISFLEPNILSLSIINVLIDIAVIMLWMAIFIHIVSTIFYRQTRKSMRRYLWTPLTLSIWKKKSIVRTYGSLIWLLITITGCIIHGMYVLAIVYTITNMIMRSKRYAIKRKMSAIIDHKT